MWALFVPSESAGGRSVGRRVRVDSDEMVGALVKLCKLIDSFTENPSLKNAATLDVKEVEKAKEEKARADRDLLAIIKLSENIQKASDSLRPPK